MAVIQSLRKRVWPQKRATTIPLPYVCPPSQQFDGNDGSWSTFIVSVGTPGQEFRVLPSTAGVETWVPGYQGCASTDPTNCPSLRGADTFNGADSPGFEANQSSTWNEIGIYSLDLEDALGYTGNGEYGSDVVSIAAPSSNYKVSTNQSIVAAIADKSYFLGLLPLSNRPSSFSSSSNSSSSLLSLLRENNQIPSLSYGYTAGAAYQGSKVPGALTLGGYDSTRFTPSNFSFSFGSQDAAPLQVGVQSIVADNTLAGTASLTTSGSGANGFFAAIDSTVPELWLPSATCDAFASNLGLSFDNSTGYYLVNDTIHDQLTSLNPSFTFKFGSTDYYNGDSINIELPYAAFDLQLSWPIYQNPTNYFPLRRANSSEQYVIGRALLQEAYIIVDYERQNFSINQVNFTASSSTLPSQQIVTIDSLEASQGVGDSSSLSGGAIAGIVVGAIAGIVLIALGIFLLLRRRRSAKKAHELDDNQVHNIAGTEKKTGAGGVNGETTLLNEAEGRPLHELASPADANYKHGSPYPDTPVQEAPSDGVYRHEMESPAVRYEMSAGDDHIPKPPR